MMMSSGGARRIGDDMARRDIPKWRDLTPSQKRFFEDFVDLDDGETMSDWWDTYCDMCREDHTDPLDMG